MSGITNTEKLEAAQRMFAAVMDAFSTSKESVIDLFCLRRELTGSSMQVNALSGPSRVDKITGTRQWAQGRGYANSAAVWPYGPKGMRFTSVEINHDPIGLIAQRVESYFSGMGVLFEGPVFRELLGNPRCIDGTALLNATHPYGPGGTTQSNLAGGAASPAMIYAAYVAMQALQTEDGDPLDVAPDTLMGGSSSIRALKSFVLADRAVPMSSAGAVDGTSSVVGAAATQNWAEGKFKVVEARRISAGGSGYTNSWFMLDTSNKQLAPMNLGTGAAVSAPVTEPTAEPMVQRSEVAYYMQAEGAILASYWPTIAGYIG